MPDNPNPTLPTASSVASPPVKPAAKAGDDKYTPEQRQKAEEKVVADAAKKQTEIDKLVDDTVEALVKKLETEDQNTRTSVMDRINQRVRSIKTVAANSKLRVPRSAVMAEEKKTMPRIVSGENRNIMTQDDKNKTSMTGGDKK